MKPQGTNDVWMRSAWKKPMTRMVTGLFLAGVFLVPLGCGSSACKELGHKECECCPSAQVALCKDAIDKAMEESPPPDKAEELCEASLDLFKSCAQLENNLDQICSGSY